MFIISKIVNYFLSPEIWIIAILLWAWISKDPKRKKKLYRAGIIMLLFFTNPFIINHLVLAYQEERFEPSPADQYSAGILLGGLVGYDRKNEKPYFSEASDRFIQTARLYKTGHIKKILISGGNGTIFQSRNFREADFLKNQMKDIGIPDSDIYIERNSRNTFENAVYSKKILDSLNLQGPFLLISSAMHLPRAKRIFKKQGLSIQPFACAFMVKPSGDNFMEDNIIPKAGALLGWHFYLKEIVGLLQTKISGKG